MKMFKMFQDLRTKNQLKPPREFQKNVCRDGFSIIEVLASIAVALIGVLGVLILVPYAVRMSATGLEIEAAVTVANNAYDQFVIEGYRDDRNWLTRDLDPSSPTFGQLVSVRSLWKLRRQPPEDPVFAPPAPFSIDPLGITEHPTGIPNYELHDTGFPFNALRSADAFPPLFPYQIPPANLVQRNPNQLDPNIFQPFDRAAAHRMFRGGDDLVFGASIESTAGAADADFNGPNQYFDVVAGTPIRRQAEHRFSWSALAFPQEGASPFSYRVYFLIYRNRPTNAELADDLTLPIDFTLTPHMRYAAVVPPAFVPTAGAPLPPVSTIQLTPGVTIPEGSIRKDDWVMLVNQRRRGEFPKHAFDWQVAFCRVINSQNNPTGSFITVDGPGFDFNPATHETTYVVHLKNVAMVYDRTIVSEGQSAWNLNNF